MRVRIVFIACLTVFAAFRINVVATNKGRRHEVPSESSEESDFDNSINSEEITPEQPGVAGRSIVDIRMPAVRTSEEDEYLCYAWKVPEGEQYIVGFKALADASNVHHMLVFGCETATLGAYWKGCAPCNDYGGDGDSILYAWAQNAPPLELPKDVGFRIGTGTSVKFISMQVHYRMPTKVDEPSDSSGVELTITSTRQKYIGGIFLMMVNNLLIPAHAPVVHGDALCRYKDDAPIYPFAYRTHAHALGRVISGYLVNGTWNLFAKGNPQWPQAFYPVKSKVIIKKGDILVARCTFNATDKAIDTQIGSTHNDEMCNLYIMYYTANGGKSYDGCSGDNVRGLIGHIPADSDVPLPPNPLLDAAAVGHMHHGVQIVADWPSVKLSDKLNLGQISGVAVDANGHVHIFHRGIRVWDFSMFENGNVFMKKELGPIPDDTLLELDWSDGRILTQWGANIFYMTHGLTIDSQNNFWVTDVALHQVMKFKFGSKQPDLILGRRFTPGSDSKHFCKPTDVAVLGTGDFFVSDGYCNSRIMKFSKDGTFIMQWGEMSDYSAAGKLPVAGSFYVPHSIAVDEGRRQVHVADRENGRLQSFDYNGELVSVKNNEQFGPLLYAVTYNNATDRLYAVNGAGDSGKAVLGSTWNLDTGRLENTWQPPNTPFSIPHDIAVCPSGQHIYVVEIGTIRILKFRNHNINSPSDEENPVNYTYRAETVTHQSIEKVGAPSTHTLTRGDTKSSSSGDGGGLQSNNRRLDITTIFLIIAALFSVPVVVAIVATLCVRHCNREITGYRRLDISTKINSVQRKGVKTLIASRNDYRDTEDSDGSERDEFNVISLNHHSSNRNLGNMSTLT